MGEPRSQAERAEAEAAAWHLRLGDGRVSPDVLEAFFAWRQDPVNADAYRRVEQVWDASGGVADDPAILSALDAALTRRTRGGGIGVRAGGRATWAGAAAAVAVAALVFAGWSWWDSRSLFVTGVGEQRTVRLADGSSVRLDTDTRLRVRFDRETRGIALEAGQALFTVAADAERPFVVEAGEATVTAVGTVFDVQRDGAAASVTLVEGVVEVAARGGAVRQRMQAGRQLRVTPQSAVTRVVDAAAETSWTQGRIVFQDTPLAEAVAEVNRYLTDKVVLDAGPVAQAPVNGVFRTGDRDAFVSTAAAVFDLEVAQGADGSVRLSAGGK